MLKHPLLSAVALLFAAGIPVAVADTSTGLSSTIWTQGLYSGGGRATNATSGVDANVGDWQGIVNNTQTNRLAKTGYIGQLFDVVALALDAAPSNVAENGTSDLTAVSVHDDETHGHPDVTWSVVSGPLSSVSTAGTAYASAVYEDTRAVVQALQGDTTGTMQLVVFDTLKDNYGLYAGDEVMDSWQVQYFGLGNGDALGNVDADGDGLNNQIEFMAGTVPTNSASLFELSIEKNTTAGRMDVVLYPAFTDRAYSLQTRTNLLAGDWDPVANVTEYTNGFERIITDLDATNRAKFYRAQIRYDWE